jgi:hypothetical protein
MRILRQPGLSIVIAVTAVAASLRGAERTEGQPRSAWHMGPPIVTYWAGPMPMTDAAARQMADGNWNLAWVARQGLPPGGDLLAHYRQQLDVLQRHALRGIVALGLWDLDDPEKKAQFDAIVDGLRTHPALYAYSLKDEPSPSLFPQLARMRAYLGQKDPARLAYVNLYPIYASNKQLGTEGEPIPAYRDYLRRFVEQVKPQLLSYDHYCFGVQGDREQYFLNLAEMRRAALDGGIPFMVIVQACSWTVNMRIPSGEELRWQAYTTLAYGSQGISYYVYGYRGHDGAMMNLADGSPTSLYYAAREVNKEFVAVARQLQPLRSLAVYHAGMLPEGAQPLPAEAAFQLDPPLPHKDCAMPVEGFVIGYFGQGQSPTHALVVNLDYRTYSGRGQARRDEFLKPVQRAIVGPGALQLFDASTNTWSAAGCNRVDIRLPPGAGLLVRLDVPTATRE